MKVLEILMDQGLARCLCHSEDADKHYFKLLASSKSINHAISGTHCYAVFLVAAQESANYRMLLAEFQLSQRLSEGPKEQTPYQSQRQIEVKLLPRSTDKQRREQIKVAGPDLLDSLANLGDGMPFIVSALQIGSGTFGIVFEVTDTFGEKTAWKVLNEARPLDHIAAFACNEFTAHLSSQTLRRIGRTTRNAALPFAVGTIEMEDHPMHGKSCFALPSKGKPGMFYAVLVTRLALCSLDGEVKRISCELFGDRTGLVCPDAFQHVASLFRCAVQTVSNVHSVGFAHRDLKWANLLMMSMDRAVPGPYYTFLSGKKGQVYTSDFGMAIPPNIKTFFAKNAAVKISRGERVLQNNAGPGIMLRDEIREAKQQTQMKLREQSALPARLKLKDGVQDAPALFEINTRSLQLLTGCFPSQAKEGDPPPPPQYASGWGTEIYAPPERNPKDISGSAQARAFQAGDSWALGAMLMDMVKGNGLRVGYQPDDSHGRRLFANCSDSVFWQIHLNKTGNFVPDEWHDCIDLIRNLCADDPEDRLTAAEALNHKFLKPRV
jgi:serine/threonine protein kinase